LYLSGTHGTSRSRAEAIVQSGAFKPSAEGLYSKGVYLWAIHSRPEYAIENARLWWNFASRKGIYAGDVDESCAVLRAEVEKTEAYYDAATQEFNENFHEIARAKGVTKENLKETFAWFLDEIAKELGIKFLVLKVSVPSPPPKGKTLALTQLISKMSPAYVVKEEGLHLIKKIAHIE